MYSTILCKKLATSSVIHDLSRSLNIDAIATLSKNTLGANYTKLLACNVTIYPQDRPTILRPKACSSATGRYYCKDYRPFPEMPEFPPVVWPNLFKSIKAVLYSLLIIKPQFDKNFSLGDFAKNSKKVRTCVSCTLNHTYWLLVFLMIMLLLIITSIYRL